MHPANANEEVTHGSSQSRQTAGRRKISATLQLHLAFRISSIASFSKARKMQERVGHGEEQDTQASILGDAQVSVLAVSKATRMFKSVWRSYTNAVSQLVIKIDVNKNINAKNNRDRESGKRHAKYNGAILDNTSGYKV
ncbi:unnamed protein product [Leuciscus chuanchicus]